MKAAKVRPERNGHGPPKERNRIAAPLQEIGLTGLRYWGGRLDEELLTELKWDKARKIYKEMGDNDPTIGALFNTITLLIRGVPWRTEGETDTDERVEYLEQCRMDCSHSWEDLLSEIARGTLQYGWQLHEIVYKRREPGKTQFADGAIGWKKFPVRAQDTLFRWEFDAQGGTEAMVQQPPPDFKERVIPLEKALLFRTESIKNSPEGRSILRNAYRPWFYKRNIENIEGIGIERDLAGFPVIWAPARLFTDDATVEEKLALDEWKKIGANIKRDEQECLVLPMAYDASGKPLYDFKLVTTGGQRQFDTSAVINRYDLRILQLMLADFIQLGHEKVGSFALASSKTNLFALAIGVFLDQVAAVFNRFAIPRLLELNGMPTEDPPQFMHGDIERRDLLELADYLSKLGASGMPLFPNPKLEGRLLELADLPVPTPEEQAVRDAELADQQAAQAEAAARAAPPTNGKPPKEEPAPAEKRAGEPAGVVPTVTVGGTTVNLPAQTFHLPPVTTQTDVHVPAQEAPLVVQEQRDEPAIIVQRVEPPVPSLTVTPEPPPAPVQHVVRVPAPPPTVVQNVIEPTPVQLHMDPTPVQVVNQVPPAPAPVIQNVVQPAPVENVVQPTPIELHVAPSAPTPIQNIVNLPEQPPATVIVQPGAPVVVPAPQVTVEAAKQATPIVNVAAPDLTPMADAVQDLRHSLERQDAARETWIARGLLVLEKLVERLKRPKGLRVLRDAEGEVKIIEPTDEE